MPFAVRSRGRGLPFVMTFVGVGLALAALVPSRASAEPEPAWVKAIPAAVAEQDADIARSGAKAVVNRLASKASRSNDVVTLYLLGRAYGMAEQYADGIAAYGDAIKIEPGCYYAWRDRGALKMLSKPPVAGAEQDFREAVRLRPDYVEALEPLGMLLLDAGRYDESIRFLKAAITYRPGEDAMRFQVVRAYKAWGRPKDALETLDPLVRNNPELGLLLLRAELFGEAGDTAGALEQAKALADRHRSQKAPLQLWLHLALSQKPPAAGSAEGGKPVAVDPKELLSVIERLRRLVPANSKEAADLDKATENIRSQLEPKSAAPPTGPPPPEAIARQLRDPDGKARERALLFLVLAPLKGFELTDDLRRALLERLIEAPKYEPIPQNRMLAIAVFEKTKDPRVAPYVRVSLRDKDGRVRVRAADALAALGNPMAAPWLAVYAGAVPAEGVVDAELSTAARVAVYTLAKRPPPAAEETPQAASAFSSWWRGPDAHDVKRAALGAILPSGDVKPYELFFPLLIDEDDEIWPAAYRAMRAHVDAVPASSDRWSVWLHSLPAIAQADLVPGKRQQATEKFSAWWKAKPQ